MGRKRKGNKRNVRGKRSITTAVPEAGKFMGYSMLGEVKLPKFNVNFRKVF